MRRGTEEQEFMRSFGKQYGYGGQIDQIRTQEFKRIEGITYLDHAGTTQYPQSVITSVHNDLTYNVYGNPHSKNPSSQLSSDVIEQVRGRILNHFNTCSEQHTVIFTFGATAALKLLAESFDWQGAINKERSHRGLFCYLQENHTSVIGMREIAASSGAQVVCVSEKDLEEQVTLSRKKTRENSHIKQFGSSGNGVKEYVDCCHNLFVFPAMCNFSGKKYPLEWASQVKQGSLFSKSHWSVVLDASSFVSTSPLDLASCPADFIPISFYKMFGFPTGLGALIVKNSSSYLLRKCYYGGGTVQATISNERFHILKNNLAERFEDGTVPFLQIVSLHHAFHLYEQLVGSMVDVLNHTHSIALYVYNKMSAMTHSSCKPLCKIYCETDFKDNTEQGPIINFNLLRANGDFVGYSEVEKMASLYNIHLRTGCFCNMGACQKFLSLSSEQVKDNLSAGHVCGDDMDLIGGKPTGSVRISFGYMSNFTDAKSFLTFIEECFLESTLNSTSQHGTSNTHKSVHDDAELRTNSILVKHSQDTTSTVCLNNSTYNSTGRDSTVLSTKRQEDTLGVSVGAMTLDHCAVYKPGPQQFVDSPHQSKDLKLEKICLYPIKSCAAFEVHEWEVGNRGFLFDRQWVIVTDSGVCLTQKREPKLCLIKPVLDLRSETLSVTATGMPPLVLPLYMPSGNEKQEARFCQTKVCGDRISAVDCGEHAASWVSRFLNKICRLIQHDMEDGRTCKLGATLQGEKGTSSLSLANESQFLLITRASISEVMNSVNQQQTSNPSVETKLHMETMTNRFRANLVVAGGKAFGEDHWKTVKIGKLVFETKGKCNRCQMVCVDQETGARSVEPMKSLGRMRGSKMPFGVHLEHVSNEGNPAILHCGDLITVSLDTSVAKSGYK